MKQLIDAIGHDSLVGARRILEEEDIDLNTIRVVCDEYDPDDPDEMPLFLWVVYADVSMEMLEMLVSYGLDITQVNREGLGAIDAAIKQKRLDIIQLCHAHGVSLVETHRRSGMTPLMAAASFGNRQLVDFFLSQGADPAQRDKRGTDAAEYARILGHTTLSKYLLTKIQ